MNIQRSILASFLWLDDLASGEEMKSDSHKKDVFVIDESLFTGERRTVAAEINRTTASADRMYGLLNYTLENRMPYEWAEISSQTPLPMNVAKKYYEKLKNDRNNAILMGVA